MRFLLFSLGWVFVFFFLQHNINSTTSLERKKLIKKWSHLLLNQWQKHRGYGLRHGSSNTTEVTSRWQLPLDLPVCPQRAPTYLDKSNKQLMFLVATDRFITHGWKCAACLVKPWWKLCDCAPMLKCVNLSLRATQRILFRGWGRPCDT